MQRAPALANHRITPTSATRLPTLCSAVDENGDLVTIPRLSSVAGSSKLPGWKRRSAAEKVEHLLGLSLDRMHDFSLGLPIASIRTGLQLRRKSFVSWPMVAAKVGGEARRERDRQRVLDDLVRGPHRIPKISAAASPTGHLPQPRGLSL
jgi:hypothetical protein